MFSADNSDENLIFQSPNHEEVNLKPWFLIKRGYYIASIPSTALVSLFFVSFLFQGNYRLIKIAPSERILVHCAMLKPNLCKASNSIKFPELRLFSVRWRVGRELFHSSSHQLCTVEQIQLKPNYFNKQCSSL